MGLENEGDNYNELFQEDDDEEEKVDRALNDILSHYSNLFFEDYVKPLIIDDHGRCLAQARAKHHVYDWDFPFPIPKDSQGNGCGFSRYRICVGWRILNVC